MQPIPLLKHRRFDPEVVDGMSAAYATVMPLARVPSLTRQLRLSRLKIIEIATRGARSPTEIHLLAMEELRDAGTGGPSLADHLADLRQAKHRNRVPSSWRRARSRYASR